MRARTKPDIRDRGIADDRDGEVLAARKRRSRQSLGQSVLVCILEATTAPPLPNSVARMAKDGTIRVSKCSREEPEDGRFLRVPQHFFPRRCKPRPMLLLTGASMTQCSEKFVWDCETGKREWGAATPPINPRRLAPSFCYRGEGHFRLFRMGRPDHEPPLGFVLVLCPCLILGSPAPLPEHKNPCSGEHGYPEIWRRHTALGNHPLNRLGCLAAPQPEARARTWHACQTQHQAARCRNCVNLRARRERA